LAEREGGLVVTSLRPGGPAATARPPLPAGAVLLAVDGRPLRSVADLDVLATRAPAPLPLRWRQGEEERVGLLQPAPRDRRREPLPELPKSWAGIEVQPLPPSLAQGVGVAASGYRVSRVYADGPAARAGLRVGDLLTALEDVPLEAPNDTRAEIFTQRIREHAIGATVRLAGLRDGRPQTWPVTLAQAPVGVEGLRTVELGQLRVQLRELGFYDRVAQRLAARQPGVLVMGVEPGGPAGLAHLKADDVLVAVGDRSVRQPEDVAPALDQAAAAGERVALQILRGGDARVVFLESRWWLESR
jgi:serine protease Do